MSTAATRIVVTFVPAFLIRKLMIGSKSPLSDINVKYEMEKTNRIAVLNMEFIPVFTKPAISSIPNPAHAAAISGRRMNATGGAIFSRMSTYIKTIMSTKPMIASFICNTSKYS